MKKIITIIATVMLLCLGTSVTYGQWFSEQTTIIDVRTAGEFKNGHLDGAINIPYNSIAKQIETYVDELSSPIMVYCRSGRRSSIAKSTLERMGYSNVIDGGSFSKLSKRQP